MFDLFDSNEEMVQNIQNTCSGSSTTVVTTHELTLLH